MRQDILEQRGAIVDELQQRIVDLNTANQQVPQEWRDMLKEVSETGDVDVVAQAATWIATLPPIEFKTAEVSWQTFALFSNDLLDSLTLQAMRLSLIGGDNSAIVQQLKDAVAIRDSSGTPAEAMDKLKAVKAQISDVAAVAEIGAKNVSG